MKRFPVKQEIIPVHNYVPGYSCPHCKWITGEMYREIYNVYEPDEKNNINGCTVVISDKVFKNTLSVVFGTKEYVPSDLHNSTDINSALVVSDKLIRSISKDFYVGICTILINNLNKTYERHGVSTSVKEHLHALVTIRDDVSYKKFKDSLNRDWTRYNEIRINVGNEFEYPICEPYEDDLFVEVPQDGSETFMKMDNFDLQLYINELFAIKYKPHLIKYGEEIPTIIDIVKDDVFYFVMYDMIYQPYYEMHIDITISTTKRFDV